MQNLRQQNGPTVTATPQVKPVLQGTCFPSAARGRAARGGRCATRSRETATLRRPRRAPAWRYQGRRCGRRDCSCKHSQGRAPEPPLGESSRPIIKTLSRQSRERSERNPCHCEEIRFLASPGECQDGAKSVSSTVDCPRFGRGGATQPMSLQLKRSSLCQEPAVALTRNLHHADDFAAYSEFGDGHRRS
jgi:hypothetical protein